MAVIVGFVMLSFKNPTSPHQRKFIRFCNQNDLKSRFLITKMSDSTIALFQLEK